jgi:hypothetical protein
MVWRYAPFFVLRVSVLNLGPQSVLGSGTLPKGASLTVFLPKCFRLGIAPGKGTHVSEN